MNVLVLLVVLALIGLTAWALIKYVPMVAPMQTVIVVAAVICGVLIVLNAMGISIPHIGMARVN